MNTPFNTNITSTGNGMNPNGMNASTSQQNQIGTRQQTANGEPQPWVTLLIVILALAGSIAGNVYLGWSYLDARQKYQALVRRTADTFRRSKSLVA